MGDGYLFKVLLYLDILLGSLLAREADITISSYCGLAIRSQEKGVIGQLKRGLGAILNWIDPGHCENAIVNDVARAKEAIATLTGVDP